MAPNLICGTASIGMDLTEFQDVESVRSLLKTLQELNIRRLDSGARYPPLNPGRSEQLIGEAKEQSGDFSVDTKVYTNTQTDGSGDLTRSAIGQSCTASLERLQRPEGVGRYSHTLRGLIEFPQLTYETAGKRALRTSSRPRDVTRRANPGLQRTNCTGSL